MVLRFYVQVARAVALVAAWAACTPANAADAEFAEGKAPAPVPGRIQRLEKNLAEAPADRRFEPLLALARTVTDRARAESYAQQAQAAALTPRDRLRAELELAWIRRRAADYAGALKFARAGEASALQLGEEGLRLQFLTFIAYTLQMSGERPAAVEAIQRAIILADKSSDTRQRAIVYNTAGLIYDNTDNSPLASEYFEKTRALSRATDDHNLFATASINLANILIDRNELTAAHQVYDEALAACARMGGWPAAEANVLVNRAGIYLRENQPSAAIPLIEQAIARHTKLGRKPNIANARAKLATALRMAGRTADALEQLRRGLPLAEALGTPALLETYHTVFAETYEAQGDYQRALESSRRAAEFHDKLVNEASKKRIAELRETFDATRRARDLTELREKQALHDAELASANWQRVGLGALLLLVGGTALAIINRHRFILRTKNRVLAETEAAKRAAEEADMMKTRLLGVAAHDIKSPLANVAHLVEQLRNTPAIGPDATHQLDRIQGQVRRILGHARAFLDGAALDQGQLVLFPAPIDLAEIAHSVVAEQRWHAESKRQTLEFAPAKPGTGHLTGDFDRLHQIVANLVDNAIKFSPEGATTRLTLERTAEQVRLAVEDRGPGLTPETLRRLFTPFTRLSAQATAGESSHGLGLSIAQEIARLHGGRIVAQSAEGGGARFTLELPLNAA